MFLSMTGFGRAEREFSWGTAVFELSSINHKYQDFSVKFPRELLSLENRMLSLMRSSIVRGKVRLAAEVSFKPGARVPAFDEESLLALFKRVQEISIKNNLKIPDDLTTFLLIPGVLDLNSEADKIILEQAKLKPEEWDEFFYEVLDSLMEMKKSEGRKMYEAVKSDIENFSEIIKNFSSRWEIAKSEAVESLRLRVETVLSHYNLEFDEPRIAEEVTLLSDKWDVSEELARLAAHTEKFKKIMETKEPVGKKLDFLIQEMNREANTMGSKVNDAECRWYVVEAKSCLERIREQIQNIE